MYQSLGAVETYMLVYRGNVLEKSDTVPPLPHDPEDDFDARYVESVIIGPTKNLDSDPTPADVEMSITNAANLPITQENTTSEL